MMNISCYIDTEHYIFDFVVLCDPVNPIIKLCIGFKKNMKTYHNYADTIEPMLLLVDEILKSVNQMFLISIIKEKPIYQELAIYRLKHIDDIGEHSMGIISNTVWKHVGYQHYA